MRGKISIDNHLKVIRDDITFLINKSTVDDYLVISQVDGKTELKRYSEKDLLANFEILDRHKLRHLWN